MPRYCEATLKKAPHPANLAEGETAPKKPVLLRRRLDVPELKKTIRLTLSEEGAQLIKDAGGVAKFVLSKEEKQLTPTLKKIYDLLPKPKKETKTEESASEEKPAEEAEAPAQEEASKDENADGNDK